jgi:hypothetical protein
MLNDQTVYRLKQVALNDRDTYSPIQTLIENRRSGKLVLYPNPTTDGRTNIAFGDHSSLRDVQVLDLNGQLIQQWLSINRSKQQIKNLKKGNYIIKVWDHLIGWISTEKLIVQ